MMVYFSWMLVLTTSGKDGYCTVRNKQKSVSINNPYFIQFLSYTVSPVLITNNTTLYLHIQVPLSLLLALWFLWKDLQNFL